MNPALLDAVLARASGAGSRIHGPDHWAGVAAAGYTLCEMIPEANPSVVLLFSCLHDAMREGDAYDPGHGARAARLALHLREAGVFRLEEERFLLLEEALVSHDKGGTSADPTIGACFDADRLTLWRLGRRPDRDLLSTGAAKTLTSGAASRPYGMLRFLWPALFLNYDVLTGGIVGADLGGSPYPRLSGESVYLRFGDLPEGGRSYAVAFARFGREFATSTYAGERAADGTYRIDLRRGVCGLDTRFLRSLLCLGRPLYVVRGSHVGFGSGGEPVLDGARIVEEVPPEAFAGFVPERPFLAEAADYWRAKRTGGRLPPQTFMWPNDPDERRLIPRQSEAPRANFGEKVEKKKREYLKAWGLLEMVEKDEAQRRTPARPVQPVGPVRDLRQTIYGAPWKEARWK